MAVWIITTSKGLLEGRGTFADKFKSSGGTFFAGNGGV